MTEGEKPMRTLIVMALAGMLCILFGSAAQAESRAGRNLSRFLSARKAAGEHC